MPNSGSCKNTFVHTKNRKEATIHTIKWCKIHFYKYFSIPLQPKITLNEIMRSIKTVLHTALFLLFVLTFASCIKKRSTESRGWYCCCKGKQRRTIDTQTANYKQRSEVLCKWWQRPYTTGATVRTYSRSNHWTGKRNRSQLLNASNLHCYIWRWAMEKTI